MANALVTGGCGFVGRHFSRWLLDHGYEVTIVDNLSSGLALEHWPDFLKPSETSHLRLHYVDFRDFAKEVPPDFSLIIHLAAVVGGRLVIDGDPLRVATDLAIDATFFNWIAMHKTTAKVVYFSSSAAYPISDQTEFHNRALNEDLIDFRTQLGLPDMTYGWTKLTGEFLASHAIATYGLDIVVYRPFSGYGEDQDFSYPFPSIIRRVGRRESPLIVWGSGRQLRDFIHIDDIVESVFASAWSLAPGEVLNLGSGIGFSFAELALLAGHVIGHDVHVVNDATKPEGVFARVSDCSRMLHFYRPTIPLEEGIDRTYRYQLSSGFLSSSPTSDARHGS